MTQNRMVESKKLVAVFANPISNIAFSSNTHLLWSAASGHYSKRPLSDLLKLRSTPAGRFDHIQLVSRIITRPLPQSIVFTKVLYILYLVALVWFGKKSQKVPAFWKMAAVTVIRQPDYMAIFCCDV